MAKFIKSIFQSPPPERIQKNVREHGEGEREGESPVGEKGRLSMSRSGRLKHAYKKRHSLSMELYGTENDMQPAEKPKSMEYHVNTKGPPIPEPQKDKPKRKSVDSTSANAMQNGSKSPEEEIDSAFDIIDKS